MTASRHLVALGLGVAILALTPPAGSQSPDPTASGDKADKGEKKGGLAKAVETLAETIQGLGGALGVAVIDVGTGEVLASHSAQKALNPASNAKLLTAATALAKLKPGYRYLTTLHGKVKSGVVSGLVLRGTGDPSLTSSDLWALAEELKDAGVKKIEGDLLVDQRFFDDQNVPPAFEQQPNEWAPFRAPVSALAVNGNTVTMTVRAGQSGGAAVVSFDPPGFVDSEGSIKTVESGAAQSVGLNLKPAGTRLGAQVSGSIPEGSRPLSFTKRVDNPTLLAGYVLKAVLAEKGITLGGEVKAGGEKSKAPAIATHRSKALSTILHELGKQSDNFYAEMVFKSLALEQKGRPARAGNAVDVVTQFVGEIGAMEEGVLVKNGSGLFDANRVTASSLAKLLRAAYRDPAYGHEFVAQLAIGGQDGTLRSRYKDSRANGVVRAKTGTLDATVALSGYILAPPGKDPIAFSILVNNVSGKVGDARIAIDKCVESAVRSLWKSSTL